MNLVTTGNAAVSITTCIVGLLMLAPRTNVVAAVRFAVTMMRRDSSDDLVTSSRDDAPVNVSAPQYESERELVDA